MITPPVSMMHQMPTLMRNARKVAQNYGHYLTQNHGSLRTNILVFSSLILVLSRIGIAQASAKKTEGTPEGPFRYREAIRTTIREAVGWTLSFMLLRFIEKIVRDGLVKAFKIKLAPPPELLKQVGQTTGDLIHQFELRTYGLKQVFQDMKGQVSALFGRKPLPEIAHNAGNPFYGSSYFSFAEEGGLYKKLEGFIGLFSGGKTLPAAEKMRNFYRLFPTVLASIPAIGLSGFALERFNMDYSQQIFDAIASRKQKKTMMQNPPSTLFASGPAPAQTAVPMSAGMSPFFPGSSAISTVRPEPAFAAANADRFSAFVAGVQQKKLQRGLL